MKKLSIEEKAKAYDEALKVLHKYDGANIMFSQSLKEEMFPELKESEGEKIRKEIISALKFANHKGVYDKHIAWLEKQGEHANFINKIQIGDKVTRNEDGVLVNLSQLNRVAKKDEKQGKNNMGISGATKQKLEDNLNKALEKETPESWNKFLDEQKPAWSKEDEDILNTIINHFKVDIECTDEDDIVRWLKSLKDRVQLQREWDEEDKEQLDRALYMMEQLDMTKSWDDVYNWLKSLRPQNRVTDEELAQAKKEAYNEALDKIEYHSGEPTFDDGWSAAIWYLKKRNAQPKNTWKPSESVILLLESIAYGKSNPQDFQASLVGLIEQLKKLRGK